MNIEPMRETTHSISAGALPGSMHSMSADQLREAVRFMSADQLREAVRSMNAEPLPETVRAVVKEAVSEALRGSNIIDGPTHIAHHQAVAEFLSLAGHAKKTLVGAVVFGLFSLLLLGVAAWKAQ